MSPLVVHTGLFQTLVHGTHVEQSTVTDTLHKRITILDCYPEMYHKRPHVYSPSLVPRPRKRRESTRPGNEYSCYGSISPVRFSDGAGNEAKSFTSPVNGQLLVGSYILSQLPR